MLDFYSARLSPIRRCVSSGAVVSQSAIIKFCTYKESTIYVIIHQLSLYMKVGLESRALAELPNREKRVTENDR